MRPLHSLIGFPEEELLKFFQKLGHSEEMTNYTAEAYQ